MKKDIKKVKRTKEEILFKTVKEDNILPITSICKLNCIFCSHKNNPSEIETYSFGHLEKHLIKTMIEFLNPERPVFIGESASKIIEGEPFAHPEIYEILEFLRERWPEIEIRITTSASFIPLEKLRFLEKLAPIELNISLNAPVPEDRVFLMNDSQPENVFKIIKNLGSYNIDFEAGIVSMHHLKDFEYLNKTFAFLEKYPPKSLRVFMAGFSRYADPKISAAQSSYQRLNNFIAENKEKYSYPIIIEPQVIKDLKAEVNGVINDSSASAAAVKSGDIIIEVNGKGVESRVDAFYKIQEAKNPEILVNRNNQDFLFSLEKRSGQRSGLIMSYDLEIEKINKLNAYLKESRINGKNISTVIVCSEFAFNFLYNLFKNYLNSDYKFELIKAENNYFGGSIISAGLLTNQDIFESLNNLNQNIDRIILPAIVYDYYGNDLLAEHYTQLEDEFEAEVILI